MRAGWTWSKGKETPSVCMATVWPTASYWAARRQLVIEYKMPSGALQQSAADTPTTAAEWQLNCREGGRRGRTAEHRNRNQHQWLSVDTGGHTGVTTSRGENRTKVLPARVEDITCSQHLWLTEAAFRQYQIHIFIPNEGKKKILTATLNHKCVKPYENMS